MVLVSGDRGTAVTFFSRVCAWTALLDLCGLAVNVKLQPTAFSTESSNCMFMTLEVSRYRAKQAMIEELSGSSVVEPAIGDACEKILQGTSSSFRVWTDVPFKNVLSESVYFNTSFNNRFCCYKKILKLFCPKSALNPWTVWVPTSQRGRKMGVVIVWLWLILAQMFTRDNKKKLLKG